MKKGCPLRGSFFFARLDSQMTIESGRRLIYLENQRG